MGRDYPSPTSTVSPSEIGCFYMRLKSEPMNDGIDLGQTTISM